MSQLLRLLTSSSILNNNQYLQSRNAAGTGLLDLIRANSSDNTEINVAGATGLIRFMQGGTRLLSAYTVGATQTTWDLYSGDSSRILRIATTNSSIFLGSLTNHDLNFSSNNISRLVLNAAGTAFGPVSAGTMELGTSSAPFNIVWFGNGTVRGILNWTASSGIIGTHTNHSLFIRTNNANRLSVAADGSSLLAEQDLVLGQNTTDGTDDRNLSLSAGSTAPSSGSRGSVISLRGNEVATVGGSLELYTGNVSTAQMLFRHNAFGATANFKFQDGAANNILTILTGSSGYTSELLLSDTLRTGFWKLQGGGGANMSFGTSTNHPIAFFTNNVARLTLAADGSSFLSGTALTFALGTSVSQNLEIRTNNLIRWTFLTNGNINQDITNGADIILSRGLTSVRQTTVTGIVAAGTDRVTATALTGVINQIGGGSGGVALWAAGTGSFIVIYNAIASTVQVYPSNGTDQINSLGGGNPIALPTNSFLFCTRTSGSTWNAKVL